VCGGGECEAEKLQGARGQEAEQLAGAPSPCTAWRGKGWGAEAGGTNSRAQAGLGRERGRPAAEAQGRAWQLHEELQQRVAQGQSGS